MIRRVYEHKVQYYETDQMGIVHHSNYIRWFEEARVDVLDQIGIGYKKMEEAGVISPVPVSYTHLDVYKRQRLGGPTCLAGDIIGDYSFDKQLNVGDAVIFEDMALYTMVKTNTFNGMRLPSIVWQDLDGKKTVVKTFEYEDFKMRLS